MTKKKYFVKNKTFQDELGQPGPFTSEFVSYGLSRNKGLEFLFLGDMVSLMDFSLTICSTGITLQCVNMPLTPDLGFHC